MSAVYKLLGSTVLLAVFVIAGLPFAPAQGTKKIEKKEVVTKETTAAVFEVYEDKGKHFRFRLKVGDKLLATAGHGYDTMEECEAVVREIQRDAARAKIVVHEAKK